jgi:hypothetical protein
MSPQQQFVEQRQRLVELILGDHQRRRQQQQVAARGEGHARSSACCSSACSAGASCGQVASGARVPRSATSRLTPNIPWPLTSPMHSWRACNSRSPRACAAQPSRTLDQPSSS